MSDNQGALIERAIAWCRAGERSDAEYLDREFAYTLVKNPLLFVAFRAGQRDRQAKIEDLNLDLRAAEDECGTLREDNATLRQEVEELRERNRKQDDDIIGDRSAINSKDAEIAAREATIREQAAEIERLREAVRVLAWTRCEDCGGTGTVWGGPIEDPQECQCQRCCAEGIVPPTNEDRRIEQLLGEDFVLRALSANDRGESREEEGE